MSNPKLSDIFRITAEEIHMSQKELSEKTGISVAAISHYFTGSRIPTLRNFYLICLYLGLDTEYVLRQIIPVTDSELRKVNRT